MGWRLPKLLVVLGICWYAWQELTTHKVNQLPPFELSGLYAKPVSKESLLGQPMLLTIWATWCGWCRKEHGQLNRIAKQGYRIVGVLLQDDPVAAWRFLEKSGNPYYKVMVDDGQFARSLGVGSVPVHFVVDAEGKIQLRVSGEMSEIKWAKQVKPLMDQLSAK